MRPLSVFIAFGFLGFLICESSNAASNRAGTRVTVVNDSSQPVPVTGSVTITNQAVPVAGSVAITNQTVPVSGSVAITNQTVPVSGSVAITNQTVPVTGSVAITNQTIPVSGNVTVTNEVPVIGNVTITNQSVPVTGNVTVTNLPNPLFKPVGCTQNVIPSESSLYNKVLACVAEFVGSRICTSEEAVRFAGKIQLPSTGAFVMPSVVGVTRAYETSMNVLDFSGLVFSPYNLYGNGNAYSMGIAADGRFSIFNSPLPVMCCAP